MTPLLVSFLIQQQEERENPEFAYWKSCKIGSWSKILIQMDGGGQGQKVQVERTFKLLEIDGEKVKLEAASKVKVRDLPVATPGPQRAIEIVPKSKTAPKIVRETEEEITVAGKKLKCRRLEFVEGQEGNGPVKGKVWLSEEIPGGLARLEGKGEGPREFSMKVEAVEWEKK